MFYFIGLNVNGPPA